MLPNALLRRKLPMKKTLFFMTFFFCFHTYAVKDGYYRLELSTQHAKIPFIMKSSSQGKTFEILNGEEVIELQNIKTKKKNHLTLEIPTYQVRLSLDIQGDKLSGVFIRSNGSQLPLEGRPGQELFSLPLKKASNFDGKWEVQDDKGEQNVLLLKQDGQKIKGSYLTKYGDYRYFHGVVSGDEFYASSFDGVYNYLIKGKLEGKKLSAQILANYKIQLEGKRNDEAKLVDPYKLTKVDTKLAFSFPDLKGKKISLADEQFKNRPVILQIFGSWCPNCIDELNYLIPWYEKNRDRGIALIAISFERTLDVKRAQVVLRKLAQKHKLNYPMLLAGVSPEDTPEKKLPGVKNFMAFPTTIFLDKNHNVYKVHTGFNGPSTGEFYQQWQKDFNQTVDTLLK